MDSVEMPFKAGNDINYLDEPIVRIVIPTLNEEKNLRILINELYSLGFDDVVVIDGNSTDGTLQAALDCGAKVLLQKGNGKGDAIRQVFCSIDFDFDILVLMDADGSMDPKEIAYFVKALEKSDVDLVKGSRFLEGAYSLDMGPLRMFGNMIFNRLANWLCSTNYTDLCYGFLAFNKKSVKLFSRIIESNKFEVETEILVKARKFGLNVVEVPSIELERKNGESNLSTFKDGLAILKTIIKEAMD